MNRWGEVKRRLKYTAGLVWRSATAPMEGAPDKPVLVRSDEVGITFIGHSSFLLQVGGQNILCDPVFATWLILLRRHRRPGVRIQDLPAIDFVVLSHAHMDHLNRPSLRKIVRATKKRSGRAPIAIVPANVTDLVQNLGFARVVALEWWQSTEINGLTVTHTPARHWGTRWFHDHDRGFGGYMIEGGAQSIYYSGDTAYFSGFREIGRRFHPEIALLPIGAYSPDSYRAVHTSPEDALRGFVDLGATWMVPMHYGTFWLSHEPIGEPLPRLLNAARQAGLGRHIRVVPEGQTSTFSTRENLDRRPSFTSQDAAEEAHSGHHATHGHHATQ